MFKKDCWFCNGTGEIRNFELIHRCPHCDGKGRVFNLYFFFIILSSIIGTFFGIWLGFNV